MSGSFTEDSQTWGLKLHFKWTKTGDVIAKEAKATVTLIEDPEGPAKSTATQTVDLPVKTLQIARDASTATFDTGPPESPTDTHIKVRFNDSTNTTACHGHIRRSTGNWSKHPDGGIFQLVTNTDADDAVDGFVSALPKAGRAMRDDGGCEKPAPPKVCSKAGKGIDGLYSSPQVQVRARVFEAAGAATASVTLTLDYSNQNSYQTVTSVLPADQVEFSSDLKSATIDTTGAPRLSGEGVFTGPGDMVPGTFKNCSPTKKQKRNLVAGALEGLSLEYLTASEPVMVPALTGESFQRIIAKR